MSIYIFTILQLINVILSTIKSIMTIKGGKWTAVITNSIYYGYYTFVIKAVGDMNGSYEILGISLDGITIAAIITILTNFIGVYLSLTIIEKFRKDKLWLLKVTVKKDQADSFIEELAVHNLSFIVLNASWEKIKPLDIYLYSKEETRICREIMKKYNSTKYCIIEPIGGKTL